MYRIGPKKGSCPTNALQGLLPSSPSSAFSMLSLSPLLLLLPTLVPWASSRAFTEILAPRCLGRALRIFEKVSLEKAVRERERKKDSPLSSFFLLFFWIKDRDSVDRRRVETETRVREREREREGRGKRRSSVHTPPVFQFRPRAGLHSRGLNET